MVVSVLRYTTADVLMASLVMDVKLVSDLKKKQCISVLIASNTPSPPSTSPPSPSSGDYYYSGDYYSGDYYSGDYADRKKRGIVLHYSRLSN